MPKRLKRLTQQHLPLRLRLLNYTCFFTCSTLLALNIFVVPSTAPSFGLPTVAAAHSMPPPSSSELPSKGGPCCQCVCGGGR